MQPRKAILGLIEGYFSWEPHSHLHMDCNVAIARLSKEWRTVGAQRRVGNLGLGSPMRIQSYPSSLAANRHLEELLQTAMDVSVTFRTAGKQRWRCLQPLIICINVFLLRS